MDKNEMKIKKDLFRKTRTLKGNSQNRGITLIALIITIIVLLILAGVTLNMVMGENGIIEKSSVASEETNKNQALEELRMKVLEVQTDKEGKATLQNVLDALSLDEQNVYIVSLNKLATIESNIKIQSDTLEIYVKYKNYNFKITNRLEVYFQDDVVDEKVNSFEEMLKECDISNTYTVEDLFNNKDDILTKVFENEKATQYVIDNKDEYINLVTTSQIAMETLAKSNYAGNEVLKNDSWFDAIMQSENASLFDEQAVQVPILGSNDNVMYNDQPNGSYPAFRAFDGLIHSSINGGEGDYRSWYGGDGEAYIGYDFKQNINIYKFEIINSGHSSGTDQQYGVKDIGLQYCDDNDNWIEVQQYQNKKDLLSTTDFYNKNVDIKASKWRIYIYSTWDNYQRKIIGELKFYGRK